LLRNKFIGGLAALALTLGAIAVPTISGATGSTAVIALDGTFTGFNNFTSANNSFYLGQVLNQIWPSPFLLDQNAKFELDKNIVTSATSALVGGKQVVTYTINPKAVWSDGTPLTADDFIYMFQASSGDPQYTDVGGAPYDVAGNAGYNQIESVVGSSPAPTVTTTTDSKGHMHTVTSATPCTAGSTAHRNVGLCANGKTVTVTFMAGQPYPEWPGLFGLLPAHIARVVGWNSGMDDPNSATQNIVSAGPYVLSHVDQANNTYTESKNPRWWGTPAKIDKLVFTNIADDTQGIAGLAAGDFRVFQPTTVSRTMIDQASQQGGISSSVIPAYTFEHLDFNVTHSTWMAKADVRKAIALGINRKSIIAATVGQVNVKTKPLDNFIFMANQSGYKADGAAYDNGGSTASDAQAIALLNGVSGLTYRSSDHLVHVDATGAPLTFTLQEKGSSVRAAEAQIVQANLAKIGITVNIVVRGNATLPLGNFDMVIFGWAGSPLISGFVNIYGCTVSQSACAPNSSNYGNYSNKAASDDMNNANSSTTIAEEVAGYQAADLKLWQDLPGIPFYQSSEAAFWSGVSGVKNNPTQAGIDWNAQTWTLN
jgi:peptide/nickel transport system substrate-binding protein